MRRPPRGRFVAFAAIAALAAVHELDAQEATRTRVVVGQIAGATVYVDAGTEAGVITGDTLTVARDAAGPMIGRMIVLSAASRTAVLTFADDPFAITRGETLLLASPSIAAAREQARTAQASSAAAPKRPAYARSAPPRVVGPQVRGRISFDVDVAQSSTRYGSGPGQTADQTNTTPAVRIQTTVTELPGGLTMDFSARGSYRQSTSTSFASPTSIRLYSASIQKDFDRAPVLFRAGRFYNRYESYSGYWDGAMLRAGGRRAGIGVIGGFQPNRADQGFSTDLPKLTAFADFRVRKGNASYSGDVSAHRVQPTNGLPDHTFFGLSQRARFDRIRLSQELQVDRDPTSQAWEITRFYLQSSVRVSKTVDLRASVSRRRPYRLWDSVSVISYARDRVSGGLNVRAGRATVGVDVAANRDENGQIGPSYSAHLFIPRVGPVALTGSASYWKGVDYKVVSLAPGVAFTRGRTRIDAGYRYNQSDYGARGFLTHSIVAGLSVGLSRGLRYNIRTSTQWGSGVHSNRFYSGISKSFR